MPNEEYQRLLRADAPELRERLEVATDDLDDAALLATFRDLGGHDLAALLDGYAQADAVRDRPSVVFAYTIKGWTLPTEGHPANHSALLTDAQYAELAARLGADPDDPWARFPAGSAAAEACAEAGRRLAREEPGAAAVDPPAVPAALGREHGGTRLDAAGLRPLLRRPRARGARRSPSAWSPSRPTSARRPTSAAGSTRRASGRSATGSTGSPTTRTRSCAGGSPTTAATSSSASPRSTSSACSASSARRGRARASRCCRSGRSTTRSWPARSSRGRSASTRAGSRSSSARRAASRSAPRAAPTSR